MNNKYKREYSRVIDDILSDYKVSIDLIDSTKYIEQYNAVVTYCNQLILKHIYLNDLQELNNFLFRLKSFFKGKLLYYNMILRFLSVIQDDLDRRISIMEPSLQNLPSRNRLGYGAKSNNKISPNILKDIEEITKKKNKKSKPNV